MDKIVNNTNIKTVESRRGKLLWAKTPHRDASEFTDLRYTAVECPQAIEFDKWGYSIRCGENGRKLKCFIVVTMYAEDDQEVDGTTRGVAENIKNFPEYKDIAVSWQEVAVCIINDGRTKANKKTLEYAAACGYYDSELMHKYGNPGAKDWGATWDTYMHMFEFSAQLKEDANFEKCYPPMQILFGLKERNGGKLDSHLWYFNAFANHLNPKFCFLLDVGTIARPRAICKLYQAFQRNSQIAGVCGEIACFKPDYLNPVEASQHFEYKMSHILDKATESMFGYISVLPGAFSAYRYEAIRPGEDGTGPLVDYFKSITASMADLGPFKANMYLAEDRILCYEIIARNDCNWILKYVKNSVAETDVPNTLTDLVKQRRRWLNGSFFAMLYAVKEFNRLWTRSSHSLVRKLLITLQFITYVLNIILTWFLCGTFFIGFVMVTDQTFQHTIGKPVKEGATGDKCDFRGADSVTFMCTYMYLFLTLCQLVCALGNKPDKMPAVYAFCACFYGIFTLFTVVVVAFILADGSNAAWKCTDVPQIVSCQQKNVCVPNLLDLDTCEIKTPAVSAGAEEKPPGMVCGEDPDRSWECVCNEDQVGMNRLGDCQTLCADAPVHPVLLRWFTIGSLSSYFVGAALHGEFFHILFSIMQYYFMLPTYINIMSIYSYCNVHDISWGTKGIEAAHGAKSGDGKKKQVQQDDNRKRGDTVQLKADEVAAQIAAQRELSKKQYLAKEKSAVEASFQAFRSYLVIAWIASNALYVGMMFGFINQPPVDTAPAHFYICTDAQTIQMAMVMGMGEKGGDVTTGLNSVKCLSMGTSLSMKTGSYIFEPISSAATPVCAAGDTKPTTPATFECCTPVDEILAGNPATTTPAQIYLIMLFGLVIYTLGLKLIGSVLFLIERFFSNIYHMCANKRRRNDDIRRQEMVAVGGAAAGDGLSEAAIAAGWSSQLDPTTGRTYYQNVSTGQTAWEPPSESALL